MDWAEDQFYEYLRRNISLMRRVRVLELLDDLAATFTQATNEELRRRLDREGNESSVWYFITELRRRDDWVNQLLEALWNREYKDLFYKLQAQYQSYRPNRIFREPDSSPQSLPPSVNHYEAAQPDSPPRYNSLPSEGLLRSTGVQPGSSVPPALQKVQPRTETTEDLQAQEISESAALPESSSPPEGNTVSLDAALSRVLPPASAEEGASGDGISKTPVPESEPFHLTPSMDYTRVSRTVPDSSERYGSAASSPPAGWAEERVPEQPVTPGASKPLAQSTPAAGAYSPTKGAVPKKPVSAHHEETPPRPKEERTTITEASRRSPAPPIPPKETLPRPKEERTITEPSRRSPAPPVPPKETRPRPKEERTTITEPSRRSPAPPIPPKVANTPHQHLPRENASSAYESGTRDQRREQPANVNPSSCRPLNYDDAEAYVINKPGVLSSDYKADDASNENGVPPPMSREPQLEISESEEETSRSQVPGSSQPSGTRSSQRSPPPQSPPRMPEAPSVKSSSRRSPGEDDELETYGAVTGRLPNDDHLHEPEENSYEVPFTDFSGTFGIQYGEDPPPPALLMGGNDAPRHASPDNRKSRATHNTDKSEVEKTSKPSPLEDPLVISLSIAVICLSAYIVWLKYKN